MIVVRIELHSAITGKVKEIGRMLIVNDGTGTKERGNYIASLMRRGSPITVVKTATIERHPRKSKSVWVLVKKALKALQVK